jgi:hypothetical protein
MTWNMKKRDIKLSSTPVLFGMPWNLARSRRMMGRSIMSTASSTGGRIPFATTGQKGFTRKESCTYGNDANNRRGKIANPSKKWNSLAKATNVGDETNDRHWYSPDVNLSCCPDNIGTCLESPIV